MNESWLTVMTPLISAAVGGALTLVAQWLANRQQADRENQQWYRHQRDRLEERRATVRKDILDSRLELIEAMQWFRHSELANIHLAADMPPAKALSQLQTREYAWECAIWPYVNDDGKAVVRTIRHWLETATGGSVEGLDSLVGAAKFSESIIRLTHQALTKLEMS